MGYRSQYTQEIPMSWGPGQETPSKIFKSQRRPLDPDEPKNSAPKYLRDPQDSGDLKDPQELEIIWVLRKQDTQWIPRVRETPEMLKSQERDPRDLQGLGNPGPGILKSQA